MQCPNCGKDTPSSCPHCGTVLPAGGQPTGSMIDILHAVRVERSGVAALVLVFVLGALFSILAWNTLGRPARFLGLLIPDGTCAGVEPGSMAMYGCSIKVGFLTAGGPVALLILLLLVRRPIGRGIAFIRRKTLEDARFLVAPLATTALFVMFWAGLHPDSARIRGLVPQNVFPALIGLLGFVAVGYRDRIQRSLSSVLVLRRRVPRWARVLLTMLVPLALSLVLTAQQRVTQPVLKEQIVALLTLVFAYIALAPEPAAARLAQASESGGR